MAGIGFDRIQAQDVGFDRIQALNRLNQSHTLFRV